MITGKAGLRRPSGGKATICLRPVRATSKYEGSGNLTRLVPGFKHAADDLPGVPGRVLGAVGHVSPLS